MDDADYKRISCVDCSGMFTLKPGPGRPRIRCGECSPEKMGPQARRTRQDICSAPWCSSQITTGSAATLYCSDKCRIDVGNWKQHIVTRRKPATTCPGCGAEFSPLNERRLFCSEDCRISDIYRKRPGSTHRRRARQYGCEFHRVDKVAVFARDGWRCQHCGCDTPQRLQGTREPNAPELDHIVPMSKGGAHSYANTQCLCRSCNSRKGARLHVPASPNSLSLRPIDAARGHLVRAACDRPTWGHQKSGASGS